MVGVNISHKPADYLELGPNCPDEEDAPTCNECPDHDCPYANRENT